MILVLSILLAACTAYALTGFILNMANNSGDSKASFDDLSEQGLVIIEKDDTKTRQINFKKYI